MAAEKACYWMVLGVLTLMVSNNVLTRHMGLMDSLSRRSLAVAEQVSDHATRFVAMSGLMLGQDSASFARTQAKVACAQARLASMQTVLARHEEVFAQLEMQRARVLSLEPMRGMVVCPRRSLRPIPAL
jgi:hypothetical protein